MKDCIVISFYENKDTNSVKVSYKWVNCTWVMNYLLISSIDIIKRTQDGEMKRWGNRIRMVP
jgi:hypothetical protein